ncbi:cytochrome P450 [Mycena albidolilacea]|uniref:Cytochrome P450 n=1 Tax=Mycena albidolilacea TaxID=1033008 RepID=A0AAD7EZR8_9AGAR|nr:cytochrome P450 [Mycena albidolilacea]
MQFETLVAISAVLLAFLLYSTHHRTGLPRVGKGGPLGFILMALKSITSFTDLIDEGLNKYGGKAFVLPSMTGSFVLVGPENVDIIKSSDDTAINQPISINENLQTMYTMNSRIQGPHFQAGVARTDVTRAGYDFIPEVLDETRLAMSEAFALNADQKSTSVPLFHTMTHLVARITNRPILGTSLCRNKPFLQDVIQFTETLVVYAQLLLWFPKILRRPLYLLASSTFGGHKEPNRVLIPYLKSLIADREGGLESSASESPEEIANLEPLAMRILSISLRSIHTSSMFGSHAIFHLATLSEAERDDIRQEIIEAESECGYNKAPLSKMRKLDSTLRETGRFYSLASVDGTVVPSGYSIAVQLKPIHFDASVYPEPEKFDCFRFSKLRETEESVKHAFTTVENDFLLFGLGRHVCPGRFFASMVLKIMLSHLLLNYDVTLPDGAKEVPKPMLLSLLVMPNLTGRVIIKPRVGQAAQDLEL